MEFKIGDRVRILAGPHIGETGIIIMTFLNGVMLERDTSQARRFCPVKFNHLRKLPEERKPAN